MNNIYCAISEFLRTIFDSHELPTGVQKLFIESNGEFEPEGYSILVLDREREGMYSEIEFRSEKNFDAIAYYDQKFNKPEDINIAINTLIIILNKPGVLSFQQINVLTRLGILVYDGVSSRIRGASYDLIIDKEFLRSGVAVEKQDIIEIPPFDFVVVCARESANIPRNMCGTFDLKVSMFCRGIILSNGPQVDPRYQGRLLCLLFNSSSVPFRMEAHADFQFATLQFQSLSTSSEIPYSGKYRKKQSLGDYIGQYASEPLSEKMLTIPKMQSTILQIQDQLKTISDSVSPIQEDIISINTEISGVKGSSVKVISMITAFIAAALAALTFLMGYYRLDTIFEGLGGLKEKVAQLSTQTNETAKGVDLIKEQMHSERSTLKKGR